MCTEFHCNNIILIFSSADHQNIEANLINLNTVVRSMYGSMIEFRAEVKNDINSLREDLNALNESISETNRCLKEHKKHMAGELENIYIKIGSLDCLNASQHTEQLTQSQTSLNSKLDTAQSKLDSVHSKLDSVHFKLDSLTATTAQLSSDHQQIQDNLHMETAQTVTLHQTLQYNLTKELNIIQEHVKMCCNNTKPTYTCGGTGGWRQVVYLDMTDPNTTCPSGWKLTGYSKRTCGRFRTTPSRLCDSAIFPIREDYSRICGRIRAYQWGHPDAFAHYHYKHVTTIDGAYVDGVSLTHGTPRHHIWTFAAGNSEGSTGNILSCPCDTSINISVPLFVEENYFCESGINRRWVTSTDYTLHSNDTLWDGKDCLPSSTCCCQRNPPYFVKQLSNSTTDDIEARICLGDGFSNENIAVELVELYVQ